MPMIFVNQDLIWPSEATMRPTSGWYQHGLCLPNSSLLVQSSQGCLTSCRIRGLRCLFSRYSTSKVNPEYPDVTWCLIYKMCWFKTWISGSVIGNLLIFEIWPKANFADSQPKLNYLPKLITMNHPKSWYHQKSFMVPQRDTYLED